MMKNKSDKKGFTLVELLAVIVILVIIMVIALPNFSSAFNRKELKQEAKIENALKGAGELYLQDNNEHIIVEDVVQESISKKYCYFPMKDLIFNKYVSVDDISDYDKGCLIYNQTDNEYYVSKNLSYGKCKYNELAIDTKCIGFADEKGDTSLIRLDVEVTGGDRFYKSNRAYITITDKSGVGFAYEPIDIHYIWSTSPKGCSSISSSSKVSLLPAYDGAKEVKGSVVIDSHSGMGNIYICNKSVIKNKDSSTSLNKNSIVSDEMYLDNTPPVINVDISEDSKKLNIVLSDNHSGIMYYAISRTSGEIGANKWIEVDVNSEVELEYDSNEYGSYYVWAKDAAGNVDVTTEIDTYRYIEKPTNNLCTSTTYTGSSQRITSITENDGYILMGYNQTSAGTYTITSILEEGYKWKDKTASAVTFDCAINKKQLDVSKFVYNPIQKYYDGTKNVPSGFEVTVTEVSGLVSGDNIGINYSSATYTSASVGDNRTIKVTGMNLVGTDSNNYSLSNTSYSKKGAVIKSNPVTITVKKDGSSWSNSGMKISLYSGTTSKYSATASSSTVVWNAVIPGTYNVYASKNTGASTTLVDTGVDVEVSESGNATINYYTLILNMGTGISSVTGAAIYLDNQNASINATVSTDYSFVGWTVERGNTPSDTTSTSATVSMSRSTTLTANAFENIYQIYDKNNKSLGYTNTLTSAISKVSSDGIIKVLKDNSSGAVTINKNLILNTNGKTITMTGAITTASSSTVTISGTGTISNSATNTLKNSGTLIINSSNIVNKSSSYAIENDGTLTLDGTGVNVNSVKTSIKNNKTMTMAKASITSSAGNGIACYDKASLTVNSGTIIANNGDDGAIWNGSTGTIDIKGGNLTGKNAVSLRTGTLNISGGTLVANTHYAVYNYSSTAVSTSGIVNISGGNFSGSTTTLIYNTAGVTTVSGGSFTNTNSSCATTTCMVFRVNNGTFNVDGGSASGSKWIGGVYGGTMNYGNSASPNMTGNANGIYVHNGTLNFKKGNLSTTSTTIETSSSTDNININISGGSISSSSMVIYMRKGNLSVSKGNMFASNYGIYVSRKYSDVTMNISGGTIVQSRTERYGAAIGESTDTQAGVSYNITGGDISASGYGLVVRDGSSAVISGGTFTSTGSDSTLWIAGTLNLGTNDKTVSTTSPRINNSGSAYPIAIQSTGSWNFYDGVLYGSKNPNNNKAPDTVPTGYRVDTVPNSSYGHKTYLSNQYTVNYYLGNGTSATGTTKLGSSTCTYNTSCTLTSFSGVFPYSDGKPTSETWSFAGWSTSSTGIDITYENSATVTIKSDINLYAVGQKKYYFYTGINGKSASTQTQYWNPYSTSASYLTSISPGTVSSISGWAFIGYKCGNDTADDDLNLNNTTSVKPTYDEYPYCRGVYSRDVQLAYNSNGGSGSISNSIVKQYYNTGLSKDGKVSIPSFTLVSNSFTSTGYTFSKWAAGSSNGTQYSVGDTYTGFVPAVDNTSVTQTMYAKWVANSYVLVADPNGGAIPATSGWAPITNRNTSSKPVTYKSTYGSLPTPTRSGYTFDGWYSVKNVGKVTLEVSTGNYNYEAIVTDVYPGVTYNISMDSAVKNSGTATKFTTLIYDHTNSKTIASTITTFSSSGVSYSISCPSSATATNDIRILVYAGESGKTAGNKVTYSGIKVGTLGNTTSAKITSSSTVNTASNHVLYAAWTANTYTINYYLGKGTTTSTATKLGSSTCTYGSSCTLKSFSSLGGNFPYSDGLNSAKTWSFAGWSTSATSTNIAYSVNSTSTTSVTYDYVKDINLYAVGSKPFYFNSGIAPTSVKSTVYQYWNPYSTSYVTSITIPVQTNISGWTFLGYLAGSSTATSSVTYASSTVGTSKTPTYDAWPYIRSVYSRNVYLSYNANGGTGTVSPSTTTQYYNSGYATASKTNDGANVSTSSFTLASNKFTNTGYTFSKWAVGSSTGTQYSAAATYSGFKPAVDSTATTQTIYAKWDVNKVYIYYNSNSSAASITSNSSGTWTLSSQNVLVNGSKYKQTIDYGATLSSDGLADYNNTGYMNISRDGYVADSGAEWICLSGCTTSGKTFSHAKAYKASDFCNAASSSCTVTLGVNWKEKINDNRFNCSSYDGTNRLAVYYITTCDESDTGNCKYSSLNGLNSSFTFSSTYNVIIPANSNWTVKKDTFKSFGDSTLDACKHTYYITSGSYFDCRTGVDYDLKYDKITYNSCQAYTFYKTTTKSNSNGDNWYFHEAGCFIDGEYLQKSSCGGSGGGSSCTKTCAKKYTSSCDDNGYDVGVDGRCYKYNQCSCDGGWVEV